jgi:hypothetical protein
MRLIHAGLLDDGGGEEEERRILVESDAVFVRERRLSLGRLGVDLFALAGQHGGHDRASITRGAGRQASLPGLAAGQAGRSQPSKHS